MSSGLRISAYAVIFVMLLVSSLLAKERANVTDIVIKELTDREVVCVTVKGALPSLDSFELEVDGTTMRFFIPGVGAPESPPELEFLKLVRSVTTSDAPDGFRIDIELAEERLVKSGGYRIGEIDGRIVTFEFFAAGTDAEFADPLDRGLMSGGSSEFGIAGAPGELRPMDTKDLEYAEAEKVFGKLFEAGVTSLSGDLRIYAPSKPPIRASNALSGLPELLRETPPDFIVFAGTRDKLNKVARVLDVPVDELDVSPELGDLILGRDRSHIPVAKGTKSPHEAEYNDYPVYSFETREMLELAEFMNTRTGGLSDVQITLDASMGLDFYDVMAILSEVSGISIIIDPYTFQEPVGGRRSPLQTTPPVRTSGGGGGGFREAGEFNPAMGSGGPAPFYGTFMDTPFDVAFETIINSNNLAYMIIPNEADPYAKPVIFVTSRERMEHELMMRGASSIGLVQPHYADVNQLGDILINMNILPSIDTGYYVYTGGRVGGYGGGYGGGQGGGAGGSGTGSGGRGIGGGGSAGAFGARIPLPTAKSGLMIIRGCGADQAGFYNRLLGRESKTRKGRMFFMRYALSPDAAGNELPAYDLISYLVIL
ncbi:hypothetical protein J7K50_10260 [bacterium]|nr:hypothetical protein [bacterium]